MDVLGPQRWGYCARSPLTETPVLFAAATVKPLLYVAKKLWSFGRRTSPGRPTAAKA